jgi:hypothetical protein
VTIPKGATIESAVLQAAAYQDAWIWVRFTIQAEAAGTCGAFNAGSPPSRRPLTAESGLYDANDQWSANTYYGLGKISNVVQAIVNRSDWQAGNSLCVILHGDGTRWGRKFVYSFEGDAALAPRLLIDYLYAATAAP